MSVINSAESPSEELSFSHPGISVKDGYKIQFDESALISLWEFIKPILKTLNEKLNETNTTLTIEDVTDDVQATAHVLIANKDEWKAFKFLKRFYRRDKNENNIPTKVEKRIKKDKPDLYHHLPIQYTNTDGVLTTFPIELILRPDDTVKKILHSLSERAKFVWGKKK